MVPTAGIRALCPSCEKLLSEDLTTGTLYCGRCHRYTRWVDCALVMSWARDEKRRVHAIE